MSGAESESIWSRPSVRRRGPRPEFSRDEITAAAIGLADREGLSAVSMRAVAGALGTAAGSLYRYLNSRDELLALMVDAALAEFAPADPPIDSPIDSRADSAFEEAWLAGMVELAHGQLALYRRHPWLLAASLQVGSFGPRAMDYFERCLLILAPLPNPAGEKLEAIGLLTGVVSLFARRAGAAGDPGPVDPAAAFAAIDPGVHPHLVAAFAAPPAAPRTDLFERAVRGVLLGALGGDR